MKIWCLNHVWIIFWICLSYFWKYAEKNSESVCSGDILLFWILTAFRTFQACFRLTFQRDSDIWSTCSDIFSELIQKYSVSHQPYSVVFRGDAEIFIQQSALFRIIQSFSEMMQKLSEVFRKSQLKFRKIQPTFRKLHVKFRKIHIDSEMAESFRIDMKFSESMNQYEFFWIAPPPLGPCPTYHSLDIPIISLSPESVLRSRASAK